MWGLFKTVWGKIPNDSNYFFYLQNNFQPFAFLKSKIKTFFSLLLGYFLKMIHYRENNFTFRNIWKNLDSSDFKILDLLS